MYEINGVTATPGGPTTLRFHDHGYVAGPDGHRDSLADKLFGEEAGCVTALVLLASIGLFSLLRKIGAPDAAITACLWVFIAAVCYGALLALLHWTAGVVSSVVFFLFVVVTLPALLIPSYRRAVKRRWGGGGPETESGWVPGAALAGVWHQTDPRGAVVITVQRTDGSVTAYVPPADKARDLYDRFDTLLRRSRPAPTPYQQPGHATPMHQPWQGQPQGYAPHHPGHHPQGHPYG
ncbi:hypothetical protein AB0F11_37195 [Streptomyces sp. NPDC032472]|uniref:hypothetical protein n=1 Tax=Streptomyces sp. NPDC032472 TaxID=3155018 RepID=UPI0033CC0B8A